MDAPSSHHPRLYFADGDVVLAALTPNPSNPPPDAAQDGAPSEYYLFRVHKFLLAHHSPIFANMFSDVSATTAETYDGVPMVKLAGDRPEDFALLLTHFYYPTELSFRRLDPMKPVVFAGILRLAAKYLIEPLRAHLIEQVVSDWPKTLKEWDLRQEEIQEFLRDHKHPPVHEHFPEPVTAIKFAQEFGCQGILPAAFYQLLTTSTRATWHAPLYYGGVMRAKWSILEKEDWQRYVRGCETLRETRPEPSGMGDGDCIETRVYEISFLDDKRVPSGRCIAYFDRLLKTAWMIVESRGYRNDILQVYLECLRHYKEIPLLPGEQRPLDPCDDCQEALPSNVEYYRRNLWKLLLDLFEQSED